MKKEQRRLLLSLVVNSAVLITLYYWIGSSRFPYMHVLYLAFGATLGLAYVLYNRGFVGVHLTPDQLPCTMSPEEREDFVARAQERMRKSRWMLSLILPILLTFLVDLAYLFLLPLLRGVLS